MYLLGYDIGSSSVKAAIVEVETGKTLAVARYPETEMAIQAPQPDWAEQDPDDWWGNVCKATRMLLQDHRIDPARIKGIGIAYMLGSTGGYLAGFVVMAAIAGWAADRGWDRNVLKLLAAMIVAEIVMMAMAGTAAIFGTLSAVALLTKKDFGFMSSFLMVGIIVAFLAGLAAIFFQMPVLSLAVSAAFVLLMAGLILFETSQIIHGGETNYIMATVSLYVSIYNLFVSLLHLLGFASSD